MADVLIKLVTNDTKYGSSNCTDRQEVDNLHFQPVDAGSFKIIEKKCTCSRNPSCKCPPEHVHREDEVYSNCCSNEEVKCVTNAYGRITFLGFKRNTHAEYLRLSSDSQLSDVTTYMGNCWKIGDKTKLLISIVGSANSYVTFDKFERNFKDGLRKVVQKTNALVFTGGTNFGIMKTVGKALHDNSLMSCGKVRCIGILPWGVLPEDVSKQLINPKKSQENDVKLNIKLPKKRFLQHNHTHFLFVDDGTKKQFNGEVGFRHKLEKYIIEHGICQNESDSMVGVKLVIGGNPQTVNIIRDTVKNKIPVILYEGTSQAVTLFSTAYHLKTLQECNLVELENHQQLVQAVGVEYPDFTLEQKISWYNTMMECMKFKNYISLASLDGDHTLDKMILKALVKVYDHSYQSIRHLLHLSIRWSSGNFVELLLKKLDNLEISEEKNELKLEALLFAVATNKSQEALVLLENTLDAYGQNIKEMFNAENILYLYQQNYGETELNILYVLCGKEKMNKKDLTEVLKSLQDLDDIKYKEFNYDVYMQLFFYSILTNNREMVLLFLQYGDQVLAKTLIAYKIYRNMTRLYLKKMKKEDKNLLASLTENKRYFRELALKLLQTFALNHETFTRKILRRKLEKFGSKTCLSLAASAVHIDFLSEHVCQAMLTENTWCGRILLEGNSWFWHCLQVSLCLIPPFYMLLEYKTPAIEKAEGREEAHYKANKLDSVIAGVTNANILNELSVPCLQLYACSAGVLVNSVQDRESEQKKWCGKLSQIYYKGKYFYDAPITKCAANMVSYLVFLVLFSMVVTHRLERYVTTSEWIIFIYTIAFALDEIHQLIHAPVGRTTTQRLRHYISSLWNVLDLLALLIFFTGFTLRHFALNEARLFYAIAAFIWIIRILSVFSLSPHLGPYIEMIRRMVYDLLYFIFILAVFLLAYGIARFSMLSPLNESYASQLNAIINIPYKQIYADSLDEPGVIGAKNMTLFTADYASVVVPIARILMFCYTLMAAVLLINLLIARFSSIYDGIQQDSQKIWKFNRYITMQEYQNRSAWPIPFSIISNACIIWKTAVLKNTCWAVKGDADHGLTEDEKEELSGFERECYMNCITEDWDAKPIGDVKVESDKKTISDLSSQLKIIEKKLNELQTKEQKTVWSDGGNNDDIENDCIFKADVYYPLTTVQKAFVDHRYRSWDVPLPEYHPNIVESFFPGVEQVVDVGRNPLGRTGVSGKGLLKHYGPNKIIEAVVTRWKPGIHGVELGANGLKVLQVLVVEDDISGKHSLPMGPRKDDTSTEEVLPKVLCELFDPHVLTDKDLWLEADRQKRYQGCIRNILRNGKQLSNGPVHDPRNTDDAWVETIVMNYHDQDGRVVSKYMESNKVQRLNIQWMDVTSKLPLLFRQLQYLRVTASTCCAQY